MNDTDRRASTPSDLLADDLRGLILWTLGEKDDFPSPPDDLFNRKRDKVKSPAFWWRKELRRRLTAIIQREEGRTQSRDEEIDLHNVADTVSMRTALSKYGVATEPGSEATLSQYVSMARNLADAVRKGFYEMPRDEELAQLRDQIDAEVTIKGVYETILRSIAFKIGIPNGSSWHTIPERVAEMRRALEKLRRGDCWCEMAIGNPMVRNHSEGCQLARAALRPAASEPARVIEDRSHEIEFTDDELASGQAKERTLITNMGRYPGWTECVECGGSWHTGGPEAHWRDCSHATTLSLPPASGEVTP